MRRLLIPVVLLVLGLAAVLTPAARANDSQLSIMMDDDHLLYRGDRVRDDALRRMQALGVDYVRVSVLWNVVAQDARKGKKRARKFRGDKPGTYPAGNWDRYDRLVRAANRIGIRLYFNVTGPGPRFAMGKAPKRARKFRRTWQPKTGEWFRFVKAVGLRYSGFYRDENDAGAVLPRVGFWSVYNEPNQPGWLTPQWKHGIAWSPVMYRELWYYGRAALDATGHKDDTVLIGETAPLGNANRNDGSPIYPKRFVREFLCLDSKNRPYKGAAAKKRRCGLLDEIGDFRYSAWAHHPYTKKLAPTKRSASKDAVTMANVGELGALLDIAKAKGRRLPAQTYTAMTEFGYETNPPDKFSGVSLGKQADYITEGDHLAFLDKQVVANTQFLLRDVPEIKKYKKGDKRRYFTYQSGLYFTNGKAKPSAEAYRFPFLVTDRTGSATTFWGQTRFLPANTPVGVVIEYKAPGQPNWAAAGLAQTNGQGFFTATVPTGAAGTWRAKFFESVSGTTVLSREIPVS